MDKYNQTKRFHKMQLGEVVGLFLKIENEANDGWGDAISHYYGYTSPSHIRNKNIEILKLDLKRFTKWTRKKIKEEIERRRISYKWLYNNGVSYLIEEE